MTKAKPFSIIIATYTGVETISDTFASLLSQKSPGVSYEIIVIIDGPNKLLRQKVESAKKQFEEKKVPFRIRQFENNRGRFEARMEGARMASYQQILIVDDRIVLPSQLLKFMTAAGKEALIPDVKEANAPNLISMTLGKIRSKVYGKQWGGNFEPFYIDISNFDRSAKGTGAFWIPRKVFFDACSNVLTFLKTSKLSSDDTRLLREIVNAGIKIYKTAEIQVIYNSRSSAFSELEHVFQRGPKFIDYYLHPGRRFFPLLIAFYFLLVPAIVFFILFPTLILVLLLASVSAGFFITGLKPDFVKTLVGLWLIGLAFGSGLVVGLVRKVV